MTDEATGTTVYVGDFTSFDALGEYYVSVPGLEIDGQPARSAPFRVGRRVPRHSERAVLAMYGQRCGQSVSITPTIATGRTTPATTTTRISPI